MNILDLCSGIGGFRLAFEQEGHQCIGYVEKDKHARKSYETIFNTEGEWTRNDLTEVRDDEWRELRGKVDVICAGFPCQPFSLSGKRLGFDDTRGTIFFDIVRAAKEIKPKYLLLENVKGLLTSDKGNTFRTILSTLDDIGYNVEWQLCNSRHFGVSHNRERLFIVGHLRGENTSKIFPIRYSNTTSNRKNEKYSDVKVFAMRGRYNEDGTISQNIEFSKGDYTNTLTTVQKDNYLLVDNVARKITPREAWRLQSFPDWTFNLASKVCSDTQLLKQAGNSLTVNVAREIVKKMK